jgi:phosphatidylglycerol:prolipoprotein diacylglycerol transferase
MPAVMPGSFTVLGVLGGIVALLVQSAILARQDVPLSESLAASLLAIFSGLIGAKLWSRLLHPGESLIGPGWAVDGFLVVAPLVAVATVLALGLPVGLFLDATAPGMFFAVAIGRLGCFFTGCCAGRCTSSRYGIWSSDRRVGARRIPTQLLESAAGLLFGIVSYVLVLGGVIPIEGGVFVIAVTAYFVVRHFLLRLRSEPRRYLWQRRSRLASESA